MTLNNLYNLAEKEKIKIYDWHIKNAYGAFINIDKINAIVSTEIRIKIWTSFMIDRLIFKSFNYFGICISK